MFCTEPMILSQVIGSLAGVGLWNGAMAALNQPS